MACCIGFTDATEEQGPAVNDGGRATMERRAKARRREGKNMKNTKAEKASVIYWRKREKAARSSYSVKNMSLYGRRVRAWNGVQHAKADTWRYLARYGAKLVK